MVKGKSPFSLFFNALTPVPLLGPIISKPIFLHAVFGKISPLVRFSSNQNAKENNGQILKKIQEKLVFKTF